MPDLGYIDVNCHVAPTRASASAGDQVVLRDLHDRAGIGLGLAHHVSAEHADAGQWNRAMVELAAQPSSGLLAVAAISPSTADAGEQIADSVPVDCAAIWVRPGYPSARSDADRRLLRAAARAGKPLLLPITSWGDATAIAEMTAGLGVPVVLTGSHYTHFVDDLAAAERHEHVLIETSALAHFGAIETAISRIGAERVLLGTGLPARCSRSAVNAVLAARIGDDSKRKILGGNACRVFDLRQPDQQLTEAATADGAIDVHCHYGVSGWPVPHVADGRLDAELNRFGVDSVIGSSLLAIVSDLEGGNDAMAAACLPPHRLGYVVADPNDLEATRYALRRHSEPDVVGIKVHSQYSRQHTASRAMWDLFDVLASDGRPVKIHNDGAGWDAALLEIAHAHPKLPIIIAHAGLGAPSLEAARLVASSDNIYMELSSSFAERTVVSSLVEISGTDRLLLGSDAPLLNPAFVLGSYLDAGIPADRWQAVCRDNAIRLFGLS